MSASIEGWETKQLCKVARLIMGQSPDSKFYTDTETAWPFLQGCAEFNARIPTPGIFCTQKRKLGKSGAILFSVRAPVGRINIADRDYVIGRGLAAIEGVEIEQAYLEHYLTFIADNFRNVSQGSTFEAINSKELSDWPIIKPVFKEEQTKIAEILSAVDRAIEQTEALIAKQERIKTGLMQDLLTRGIDEHGNLRSEATHEFKDSPLGRIPVEWEVKPLREIVDLQVGYAFKSQWFTEEGVRLLRGENVGTGRADWKDARFLPMDIAMQYSDYRLSKDDLIIGMDRTFTKEGVKISALSADDIPSLLVQRVGRFIPLSVHRDFMQLLLQSPTYQRALLLQQKGMDIPHLSKDEILTPLVAIPGTRDEMIAISKKAGTVLESLRESGSTLDKFRSLKSALMQDLLTGRKRVTDLIQQNG